MDRPNSHEALDLERCHKGSNMFGASSDPRAVDVLVRGDPDNPIALACEVVDERAELRDANDSLLGSRVKYYPPWSGDQSDKEVRRSCEEVLRGPALDHPNEDVLRRIAVSCVADERIAVHRHFDDERPFTPAGPTREARGGQGGENAVHGVKRARGQ